jgi:hypothetical protein
MLAQQSSRLAGAGRPSSRPLVPTLGSSSSGHRHRLQPVAAQGTKGLLPLVDAFKADQLKKDLPEVRPRGSRAAGLRPKHTTQQQRCATRGCCRGAAQLPAAGPCPGQQRVLRSVWWW